MKSATNWLSSLGLALGLALVPACSTVTPPQVKAATASYDAGEPNSGFLGFTADGGGLITPHARDRYNALIALYGDRFLPALKPDAGVVAQGDVFKIDAEHLVKFATMNRWHKSGPAKP